MCPKLLLLLCIKLKDVTADSYERSVCSKLLMQPEQIEHNEHHRDNMVMRRLNLRLTSLHSRLEALSMGFTVPFQRAPTSNQSNTSHH